jgi:hypothetical protein
VLHRHLTKGLPDFKARCETAKYCGVSLGSIKRMLHEKWTTGQLRTMKRSCINRIDAFEKLDNFQKNGIQLAVSTWQREGMGELCSNIPLTALVATLDTYDFYPRWYVHTTQV